MTGSRIESTSAYGLDIDFFDERARAKIYNLATAGYVRDQSHYVIRLTALSHTPLTINV